ncbi:unnamed protein product [Closterium sp. Naga37s-1]|nr:unnamed protein product [Closterium sp. Naga37s-1]
MDTDPAPTSRHVEEEDVVEVTASAGVSTPVCPSACLKKPMPARTGSEYHCTDSVKTPNINERGRVELMGKGTPTRTDVDSSPAVTTDAVKDEAGGGPGMASAAAAPDVAVISQLLLQVLGGAGSLGEAAVPGFNTRERGGAEAPFDYGLTNHDTKAMCFTSGPTENEKRMKLAAGRVWEVVEKWLGITKGVWYDKVVGAFSLPCCPVPLASRAAPCPGAPVLSYSRAAPCPGAPVLPRAPCSRATRASPAALLPVLPVLPRAPASRAALCPGAPVLPRAPVLPCWPVPRASVLPMLPLLPCFPCCPMPRCSRAAQGAAEKG